MIDSRQLWQDRAGVVKDIESGKEAMQVMLDTPASKDAANVACFSPEQEKAYSSLETSLEVAKRTLKSIDGQIRTHEDLWEAESQVSAVRVGRTGDEDDDGPTGGQIVTQTHMHFTSFGEQLQAIWRHSQGYSDVQEAAWLNQLNAAAIGAGESIGADGGFLIQQDFSNDIFRVMIDQGDILSRVRRTPVSSNGLVIPGVDQTSRATGSRWGGVQGFWVGEGTPPTATKPKFRRIEFTLKKIMALGYATEELLEDSGAMSRIFPEAFAEELRWLAENAIINGSGAGEPLGIMNSDALITVSKETGQSAATIEFENILNMWTRMWSRSRRNAVWLINQDIEPQLYTMSQVVGTGGSGVFLPASGLSASPFATLLGRPVVPIEYAATLGSAGDIILADLSQYMTIDKGGVQQDSSIHVRFVQAETAFRAQYRIDGKPLWDSAMTPANGSNTQSPFVTLAERT